MKRNAHDIDALHFLVTNLSSRRLLASIQSALDFESFGGCGPSDQVDYCLVVY